MINTRTNIIVNMTDLDEAIFRDTRPLEVRTKPLVFTLLGPLLTEQMNLPNRRRIPVPPPSMILEKAMLDTLRLIVQAPRIILGPLPTNRLEIAVMSIELPSVLY